MRLPTVLMTLVLFAACDFEDHPPAPGPQPQSSSPAALQERTIPARGRVVAAPTALAQATAQRETGGAQPLPSLAPLVERVRGAVVGVTSIDPNRLRGRPQGAFERQWREFFRGERAHPPTQPGVPEVGVGSGVIVDSSGIVVTNNHLVEGSTHVLVQTADDEEHRAAVIGRDPDTDIAVLRLEQVKAPLPTVELGSSDPLKVGDYVVAIGSPFGLESTVTSGIISAKARVIGAGPFDEFLQTDAAINPGNSGGPLFDLDGRVVGINTAIVAGGQGIGFAVPIDMVKALLPQLVKEGRVERGYLGVSIQDVTPAIAQALNVEVGKGAVVMEIDEGSPAAKAGLKPGDVVTRVRDAEIESASDMSRTVAQLSPGQRVGIEYLREGKSRQAELRLEERPSPRSR